MHDHATDSETNTTTRRGTGGVALRRLVRHLDLFSGIGGFALAARMVGGIKTVGFCEIDPWAQQVLNKNFPNVPIHDDVKTLDPKNYGRIDLITGGYPCQPFSLAGKREGAKDDRHLWPEVLRIIKQARPRWVLCENVAGHVSMGLDEVLSDLANNGYAGEAVIIPACAKNAQHRRDRVWIIANACGSRLQGREGAEGSREEGKPFGYAAELDSEPIPCYPTSGRRQGQRMPINAVDTKKDKDREANQFKYELGWPDEPPVRRRINGVSRRMDSNRLRGLGNAIVPAVAAEILRCMMRVDSLSNAEDR